MTRGKLLKNKKGAALLYVIMALTVIVTVCVSVTLISTSLYTRTTQTASKEQAFLLAKSIGQCFASEFTQPNNDKLRYQVLDYLTTNPSGRVTASATMYFDPDSMTASIANKGELNQMRVSNASLAFYLSEDGHYLYGDVTVPYNGVTGSATVVFTYVNRADLTQNMMDLFSVYNIYSTFPDKLSFTFAKSGKVSGTLPNVYVYNGADSGVNTAKYTLSDDVEANLTANGNIAINSKASSAVKEIKGKLTGYGGVELGSVKLSGGLYVNGALTVGSRTNYTGMGYDVGARVNCDVYALNDVTVYGYRNGSTFPQIVSGTLYAEGDVVLYNAKVGAIKSSGSVTLVNSYCSSIICSGAVTLRGNSTVAGQVQAGSLTVVDSSITGNVLVKSATSGMVTTGDMVVRQTAAATENHAIGTGASSTVRVAGNASFANDSSTKSLTVYGRVYVGGGVTSPFAIEGRTTTNYPYQTNLVGSLTIMGGVKYQRKVGSDTTARNYLVNYLTSLNVKKTSSGDASSGNVFCYWSIPVFSKEGQDVMGNGSTATIVQPVSDSTRTVIEGSLYVATNAAGTFGQAGNFAYFPEQTTLSDGFFADEWGGDTVVDPAYTMYVNLNGARLNNVYVGTAARPGSMAVWNGSISGNVVAHDIKLSYVNLGDSASLAAKSVAVGGETQSGNLSIRSISSSIYAPSYTTTVGGSLSATGRLGVYNGVTLKEGSTVRVQDSTWLAGTIQGEIVMDPVLSGTVSTMTIERPANLVATADNTAIHVNGNLIVKATSGTTRSKPVYLSGAGALYGQMGTIYTTLGARITTGESYCTKMSAYDEDLPDPYASEVVIEADVPGETVHLSSLINFNSHCVIYVKSDLVVHGDVYVKGEIFVCGDDWRNPPHITVEGDLYANRMCYKNSEGSRASVVRDVTVAGDLQLDNSQGRVYDSNIGGNLKSYFAGLSNGSGRFCDIYNSTIGGSIWTPGAEIHIREHSTVGSPSGNAFVKGESVLVEGGSYVGGYVIADTINVKDGSSVTGTYTPGDPDTIPDIAEPVVEDGDSLIKKFDSDGFTVTQYVNMTMYNPTLPAITVFTSTQLNRLTLGNETYWGVRAVPLRWVTPNRTIGGEAVNLRGKGTSTYNNTLTVAYKAMASRASLKSIGTILSDGFGKLNANPFDGFGVSDALDSIRNDFGAYGTYLSESTKAVTSWAGLGFANTSDATYYRVTANASKLNTQRGTSDVLVVTRPLGTKTAYSAAMEWVADFKSRHSILGKAVEKIMETLEGMLSGIVTEYSYRPVGVFFYESGYVPEGVFWSYKDKPTSKSWAASNYYGNSASEYRTASNKQNEMDDEYRWRWGGSAGAITSSMGDCTWTFFTCADPTNPYGSAAKDLHIILPKHTYMLWEKDKDSAVNIIGDGRVFLYLQEDTNIKVVGNGWADWLHDSWDSSAVGSWVNNFTGGSSNAYTVFGGVRAVGVDKLTGETLYNYDAKGNAIGVKYMDESALAAQNSGLATLQLQPRMYIVGTGPNITFEVEDFQTAAYVYMPSGYTLENASKYPYYVCANCGARKLTSGTKCAGCGQTTNSVAFKTSDGKQAYGLNTFIVSNSSYSSTQQSDVYGIYVADRFVYNTSQNSPIHYFKTTPDLSNTILYYKASKITATRAGGMYELSEFWDYPKDLPVSNMTWTYRGLTVQ